MSENWNLMTRAPPLLMNNEPGYKITRPVDQSTNKGNWTSGLQRFVSDSLHVHGCNFNLIDGHFHSPPRRLNPMGRAYGIRSNGKHRRNDRFVM